MGDIRPSLQVFFCGEGEGVRHISGATFGLGREGEGEGWPGPDSGSRAGP